MMISICVWMTTALAAVAPLDREAVLDLARERAPVILAARARQGVAEGNLTTARAWRHNPELEFATGPRTTPTEETWDVEVSLAQRLDLAGRGDRIAAATAARDAAGFALRDTELAVVAGAARAYLVALHAVQARQLAAEATMVQERLHDVARARHEAGETGALEINLAAVALARSRAALAGAAADEATALADLASVLQVELLGVTGDLVWPAPPDLAAAQAAAARQPGLAALAARQTEALAVQRLAGAQAWPEIGVFGGWGREEDADIVHLGLNLGLPFFARGQGERRAAAAEAQATAIELDAAQRALADRVARAWQRHHALREVSDAIGRDSTAALAATVRLAEESYRLGEAALDDVLFVQREQLDARREINDLQLAAALAAVAVSELAALPPLVQGETP